MNWRTRVGIALATALLAAAAGARAERPEDAAPEEPQTVITSERLTYDADRRYALFEQDVTVTDPALRLTADRLTVRFNEQNAVVSIEAVGNVAIEQPDRRAWAERAEYDVATGRILLEGEPRVMQGRDLLSGERITFWRDQQRLVCEPRARLVLHPERGGMQGILREDR